MICTWCAGGGHTHCLGSACDCEHVQAEWIPPLRRAALRNGAEARTSRETEYQISVLAHREARRAADARRG